MPSEETSPPPTGPAQGPRRRHPLVLGTFAALAGLAAAVVTLVLLAPGDEGSGRPVPEVALELSEEDQDPASGLRGEDTTGDEVPTERFSRLEGGFGSFADYRGTPMVVNFFASNCAPCIDEMPAFEAVHQELGDQVAFVGMNFQDQVAAAQALVERTGVTYDIGRDPSGAFAQSLGMVVMPSTYFVSPEGRVLDMKAGALSAEELRQRIDEVLAP